MKRFLILVFSILLVLSFVFVMKTIISKKETKAETFNQAFEMNSTENISKMNARLADLTNGWDYSTENQEEINLALSLLKKQEYVKQDELKSNLAVGNSTCYTFTFYTKDSSKVREVFIDPKNEYIRVEINNDSGKIVTKFYSIPKNSYSEFMKLFETLNSLRKK